MTRLKNNKKDQSMRYVLKDDSAHDEILLANIFA